jgi:transmembrane sensor
MKHGDSSARGEDRELPALAWVRRAGAEDELLREIRGKVKRRRARRLVGAGALMLLLGLGTMTFRSMERGAGRPAMQAETGAATATVVRPKVRTLPDGSVVELKDGARIEIDFSGAFRRVTLAEGEAHFKVTKDKARPFIVTAGRVEVMAVGTAFSVQLASTAVDVVVTEGTVKIGAESAEAPAAALVDAGRRCVVEADLRPQVALLTGAEAEARLVWRVTQLEFSRTPLSEVVDLMNRHAPEGRRTRFEIADRELTAIKLTGYLRADNAEGLMRLLENNFRVRCERDGEHVVLHRGK